MRYRSGEEAAEPSVLVLRALGLGDLATAVPALRALRRAFPHHRVLLATSSFLSPLVEGMEFVDGMLHTVGLDPLPVQLGVDDIAVNLHGRGPESTLVLLDTSPRRLVAFHHPDLPATYGLPRWRRREHEVQRWCRLLDENGVEARSDDLALDPPRRQAPVGGDFTVIHPGASAPARQWPPDRWAKVAHALMEGGQRVVMTGSSPEVALAHEIAREAGIPGDDVLAGRTDVAELAAVVAASGLLLSSDTGPAHLATAYGTPSVVLFGPTSPHEWGPPPGRRHVALWKGGSGRADAAVPHPGLLEITAQEVLDAVDHLLDRLHPARAAATSRSATS